MYAKITKTFVESQVCPDRGQIIIRDLDLKGFGLRLTPNCKSFIVEGRVNGTQRRVTLGQFGSMSLELARKEAQKILVDWKLGIDLSKMPPLPTLQEVLDKFLAERSMKPETRKTYRSLVERSMPDWLKRPVNSISREMILSRHQQLVRPTRCGTDNKACANSAMQVLRCLMNYAASKFDLAGLPNPTEALRYRWFRMEARQGTIPDTKLPQFFRAVMSQPSKIARDFILLLLFTGLRRNEAARLKWSSINFAARTLTIEAEHNKSNRVHVLPLTPMLTAILQSRLPAESEYVFPGRYEGHLSEPRAPLAQLRQQMGWQWLLHDLRRTALSAGEKAGVPFLALQKIANHVVTRETTDRYLVLDVEFIRPHMETISTRLLELMETTVEEWRAVDAGQVKLPENDPVNLDPPGQTGAGLPVKEELPARQIAWVLIDEEEDEPEVLEGVCW